LMLLGASLVSASDADPNGEEATPETPTAVSAPVPEQPETPQPLPAQPVSAEKPDVATSEEKATADGADKSEPELVPGHSMHGEAFNEGPRQAAYLMEGMGNVNFPATTKDPETQ